MNKTTLDDEEIKEFAELFELKEIRNGFLLTYYNGHARDFCKFIAHLIRKYYPRLDEQYANAKMLTAKSLIKRHGSHTFSLFDIYEGDWYSGTTYLFTLTPGTGAIGEDVLFVRVSSEQDAIDTAMESIRKAVQDVKDIWGTCNLKENLIRYLVERCEL